MCAGDFLGTGDRVGTTTGPILMELMWWHQQAVLNTQIRDLCANFINCYAKIQVIASDWGSQGHLCDE